jgi:ParB family chromosome partitioning protein
LRAALSTRPDVALAAITHHLALRTCYDVLGYQMPSALALTPDPDARSLTGQAPDLPESRAQRALDQGHAEWRARLPRKPDGLWKWLLKQEQPVVLALLAYCVGQTVYAVRAPHAPTPTARLQAADQLAKALKFDMADWWEPTVANYLNRVKRAQVIEALEQADKAELEKLKKGDLVKMAQGRLKGTRWLPEVLKT